MFRPVALFIGLRYTRAKRRNHFISFISITSMLGIALGVTALITVLSVMNGFDEEIRHRLFSMAPQIRVTTITGTTPQWEELNTQLQKFPDVVGTAPYVNSQAMISYAGQVRPAIVDGILPNEEAKVSKIAGKFVQGSLDALRPGHFGIVIGQELADNLGVSLGDKLTVVTPQASVSLAGVIPRFKRFTLVGIFKVGTGFGFDTGLAFIHLQDAQKLFQLDDEVSGVRVQLKNLYQAPKISNMMAKQLPPEYQVTDWTQEYGDLFQAIKLEKNMMFIILLLIIAVAAFNLVSTLVMVVTDKKSDIAILRTLGATPRTILATFMVQGTIVGFVGTLFGFIFGVLLALNITALVAAAENYLGIQLLASNMYYVNYLPSKIDWNDVANICGAALVMSLLATIYPAWRASRTQPAEALRYE